MTDCKQNHVTLSRLRMHYVRDGDGPTLVLLHGWPEFWYTWRKNIPALAESFDVVVPDLRGFGDSEKPPNVPDVSDYADDLIELLDALDIDRAGFVGHDVGALSCRISYSDIETGSTDCSSLTAPILGLAHAGSIKGTIRSYGIKPSIKWTGRQTLVGHNRDTCRLYFRHFLDHWSHSPGRFDQDLEAWVDNFMKPGNLEGGFNWYRAVAEYRQNIIDDGVPDTPPIDVPCYVLWGKRCRSSFRMVGQYPGTIFKCHCRNRRGRRTFVHYEQPSLANQRIMSFFSG